MKLTQIEKTILGNLKKQYKKIEYDEIQGLILWQERKNYDVYTEFDMFENLFKKLETDKKYNIKELLEEK